MGETFKCIQCGRNFILSYSEQRYYREQGRSLPQRCDACRAQGRQVQKAKSTNFIEKPAKPSLNGFHPQPHLHHTPQKLLTPKPEPFPTSEAARAHPRRARHVTPYYRFGLLSLGLTLLLMIIILGFYEISVGIIILAWLLAINLVTLLVYRYDKLVAGKGYTRVPEAILLSLAALGGSPSAYIAMYQIRPRHKTQSPGFLLGYWAIIAVQVVGLILYFGF